MSTKKYNSKKYKNKNYTEQKKSSNKDFKKNIKLDLDAMTVIDKWLNDNNKFGSSAEITFIFSKKRGCFVGEKFSLGLKQVDDRSNGRDINNVLSKLFFVNEPSLNIKNIEKFLKNGESELRIETLAYPTSEIKYATSIYDQSGPCEIMLNNTISNNIQTALENLDNKLCKSNYKQSDYLL